MDQPEDGEVSPRPVLVLGMHRSGTSAVTHLVSALGLELGPECDLYSDPANPRGHWESRTLIAMNNRILLAHGGTSVAPPRLAERWQHRWRSRLLYRQGRSALGRVFRGDGWVWKDPRNCLTLPFWRHLIRRSPVGVFVWRHPSEVAMSLQARDSDLPLRKGVFLWERYVRSALSAAHGMPVVFVEHRELVERPFDVAERLASTLKAFGVRLSSPASIAGQVIEPSLHRQRTGAVIGLTQEQQALLERLRRLPSHTAAWSAPDLGEESPEVEQYLRLRRPASLVRHLALEVRGGAAAATGND